MSNQQPEIDNKNYKKKNKKLNQSSSHYLLLSFKWPNSSGSPRCVWANSFHNYKFY